MRNSVGPQSQASGGQASALQEPSLSNIWQVVARRTVELSEVVCRETAGQGLGSPFPKSGVCFHVAWKAFSTPLSSHRTEQLSQSTRGRRIGDRASMAV